MAHPSPTAVPTPFPVPARQHWFADLSFRLRTYRGLLKLVPLGGGALIDLGCGPGLFAKVAQRHGFRVTAVDAREPWAYDGTSLPDAALGEIEFVQGDIRAFDVSGFDVVTIIGLLYHLRLDEQIELLKRCRGKTVIVDTELYDAAAMSDEATHRIRAPAENSGYDGVEWVEHDRVWSSSGNPVSFWLTRPSLLQLFEDAGFDDILTVEPGYRSAHGPRQWFLLNTRTGAR